MSRSTPDLQVQPKPAPRPVTQTTASAPAPVSAGDGPIRPKVVLGRAVPMAVGTMPVGFAFAALAHAAGMPALWVMAMSMGIYACSSQIVAVTLLAAGQPAWTIVVTCGVVNLRHILMSSVMAPYVQRMSRPQICGFAFLLCDEAFALHAEAVRQGGMRRREVHVANIVLYVGWLMGNVAALIRPLPLAHLQRWGLDYAPTGMFIGLLALLIRTPGQALLAAACGAMSVGFARLGEGGVGLVITALLGATGATLVSRLQGARQPAASSPARENS